MVAMVTSLVRLWSGLTALYYCVYVVQFIGPCEDRQAVPKRQRVLPSVIVNSKHKEKTSMLK